MPQIQVKQNSEGVESVGVEKENERKEKSDLNLIYTPEEAEASAFFDRKIRLARDQRESASEFLDGRGYTSDYVTNRQAGNSYLKPKMNDDEIRVVTGVTEKKIEVAQNELLAINLQHEVRAFDMEDNEITQLGEDIAGVVKRTNEIEKDQDMWEEVVREFLIQRGVFVEEYLDERKVPRGNMNVTVKTLKKRILSGLKVFLGDISMPLYLFDNQPFLCIYDKMSYDEAEAIWGENDRWDYVVAGSKNNDEYDESFDLRLYEIEEDQVEIITYLSSPHNEKQVKIQGVMMLPLRTPLDHKHEGYNIKAFGLKSMSPDYAYCKGLAASAKVLQALDDETIRLLIRKFRQVLDPPSGVRKNYSKDIWAPGAKTVGVKKGDIEPLIGHDGVTNSEFAMWGRIEEKIEEFVSQGSLQQGLKPGEQVTATEIMARQRQAAKMLGLAVLGYMRMKRELTYLRIYNIFENYADPVGKMIDPLTKEIRNVFRKFTILDSDLGNGKIGKKIVAFNDRPMTQNEKAKTFKEEKRMSKLGKHVRYKSINLKRILEVPQIWFVNIIEKSREGTPLDRAMFEEKLGAGMTVSKITGVPLAGEQIVEDFGRTWSAKDWFQRAGARMGEVAPPGTEGAEGGDEGVKKEAGQLMEQIKKGLGNERNKPSVNTLEAQI